VWISGVEQQCRHTLTGDGALRGGHQGFNDKSGLYAEAKIVAQLRAVKERDPSICTVF
jgi:hypothetical protein